MSEHKRVRTHYSQLPEEEKEWLRARKKTLAAEWKEKESQLVFVDIQQVDDLANPIEVENLSSFSAAQIYNHRNLTAAASGSSTLQPHNRQDEYCMAIFKPPKAMRGGIPICFPQFGNCGSHGICKEQNMDHRRESSSFTPQMIRLENPLLTCYSNHLKKI
ncbi:hypothetical protein Vadar_021692 [Vaccinium darrowii]|uniref:Uncharacterized protein n=1 Tax=Vaccinium darrowii TaxID=229202 RepID=A0ACB7YHB3_9ERIC|nr:hypothetical protein Vadar_021692 [Vaccinium darrowii]